MIIILTLSVFLIFARHLATHIWEKDGEHEDDGDGEELKHGGNVDNLGPAMDLANHLTGFDHAEVVGELADQHADEVLRECDRWYVWE